MGDNLLLMDSPAPRARSSVLHGHLINREHALLGQPDSPCGVDRLLNFSPKVNEVNISSLALTTDDSLSELLEYSVNSECCVVRHAIVSFRGEKNA